MIKVRAVLLSSAVLFLVLVSPVFAGGSSLKNLQKLGSADSLQAEKAYGASEAITDQLGSIKKELERIAERKDIPWEALVAFGIGLAGIFGLLTKEASRYAKAYGGGGMEFDQYMELAKITKRKKEGYEKQLEELKARVSPKVVNIKADELCSEAKKVITSLDFNKKKNLIRDIIEKVIIKERSEVEVLCHIPLPQLSLTSAEKLGHEPISRDRGNAKLPFFLRVKLPIAKKGRIITKRDRFGKILAHQVPSYF